MSEHFDVVIIGAGLSGLSLSRHLSILSDKTVLLLDKRDKIPPLRQKVGEATVQLSGYYFSKVLDLEEHLVRDHFMKYNLRFFYKTAGNENRSYEDYSQSYIRPFSNIASYQLDRNLLEAELLRLNTQSPNISFCAPVTDLQVTLRDNDLHEIRFQNQQQTHQVFADWVVDTSGRSRFLARQMHLAEPNDIRHGASFVWVDGLINVEKLTDRSPQDIRLWPGRSSVGHLPLWLATNHFVGEGYWLWMIPLPGKTSLGLVYDKTRISHDQVSTPQKLIEWLCHEFPLLARDLPDRKILDRGSYKDFSYGCKQTIHPAKWALSGESGRFTDPLYSPGGDSIAIHNTLIVDAILTAGADELAGKCQLYEVLMQSIYESFIPSFSLSYDVLGDQEAFALKYTWELSVYFVFFVFPFINDLFTKRLFLMSYLGKFSRLGTLNKQLQAFISAYYQWKKWALQPSQKPCFYDFTAIGALRHAESTFYQIGVSIDEARRILDSQLDNLNELARYLIAYMSSVVLADERVLTNRAFVESIDLKHIEFNPADMAKRSAQCLHLAESYTWSFDPFVLDHLRQGTHSTVLTYAEVGD